MYALLLVVAISLIQHTDQIITDDQLNLLQDEEYRQFCRRSSFQRGEGFKPLQINRAERNEFFLIQVAKVNTDCNFQLTAVSQSNEEMTVHNIFPTDHPNQNVIVVAACSKLLRQSNYFRVWYHHGGILRKKPYDDSEGIRYVQISPEPKCSIKRSGQSNTSSAFVHITMTRLRLPLTENTTKIWERVGNGVDAQQPKFRSYAMLTDYQKSIFVPDSFHARHSPTLAPYGLTVLAIITVFLHVIMGYPFAF